jgi:membrane protein
MKKSRNPGFWAALQGEQGHQDNPGREPGLEPAAPSPGPEGASTPGWLRATQMASTAPAASAQQELQLGAEQTPAAGSSTAASFASPSPYAGPAPAPQPSQEPLQGQAPGPQETKLGRFTRPARQRYAQMLPRVSLKSVSVAEVKAYVQRRSRRIQQRLRTFPWGNTWHVLSARFREDRLGVTASSLTFTSLLALVPFFTVALALFTAFPIFGKVQQVLERWLMDSLIPETIARQVLGYLTQFASKASQLGLVGFSILIVTAVALILTIDRTLNNIWRVRQLRPLGQRVLIYWAAITLGPLVLGLSLVLSSYVMSASKGLVNALPGSLRFVFDSIEFMVLAAGMAGLYHYVPNTPVRWRHAWVGGVFVAVCMELAKKMLGIYMTSVPTYSVIYGAFATLPILLIWMYVAWCIVLLGALVTAYLPTVLAGVERLSDHQGWQFELAVEILQCLARERELPHKGLYLWQLARRLRMEPAQILPVLQALAQLDWVGAVYPPGAQASLESTEPRHVLLVDPRSTPVAPLVQALLLVPCEAVAPLWRRAQLSEMTLAELL